MGNGISSILIQCAIKLKTNGDRCWRWIHLQNIMCVNHRWHGIHLWSKLSKKVNNYQRERPDDWFRKFDARVGEKGK